MESSTGSEVKERSLEAEADSNIPPVLEAIVLENGASDIGETSTEPLVDSTSDSSPPTLVSPFAEFQSLDPNFVQLERIGYGILLLIALIVGAIPVFTLSIAFWGQYWVVALLFAIYFSLAGLILWAGYFFPPRTYRTTRWRLNERGFDIRRGVWWKKEITVPRARVQHTDVHQGPLARKFGIAKLVVHTAGTHEASVELDGLNHQIATQIRDILIADEGAIRDAV
jgi:uncharacterized protein